MDISDRRGKKGRQDAYIHRSSALSRRSNECGGLVTTFTSVVAYTRDMRQHHRYCLCNRLLLIANAGAHRRFEHVRSLVNKRICRIHSRECTECKFPRVMYDWADSLVIRTVHYIVFWALFIAAHYQVACRPGPAAYDERSLRP